ncbi:glycoside hydrolase family 15 protein [Micromonospora saelicesensis]|uniref:Glucoamylase (Glucan-1,4-alpha-glucosidase), GH15 family n=1 Tax=Micromonospora saelicesensis TaxID=285676 RepID=A0A1C5A862_9ACTN|nr:glycoside hydrolase family 15 protein [Micromonospora saelicesensis]SCF41346.1 Glucoamylase (glucan-1,4-alpha-glucosidase), GH15 family [Micromonospora saelicesensis]
MPAFGSANTPPIDSYAFLSDTHTGALIGADGTVDWFCVPHFDGDAVFARLLDRRVGGAFTLSVAADAAPVRRYLPGTLVVESVYRAAGGSAVGQDFLAVQAGDAAQPFRAGKLLVRRLHVRAGSVRVRAEVTPRPGYGSRPAEWHRDDDQWVAGDAGLRLVSELPFRVDGATARAEAVLHEGQTVDVLLGYGPDRIDAVDPADLLEETRRTWREWSDRADYTGHGREQVRHSAAVLRGLSFDETGALLAAPTSSLPEEIGGVRNWDYRYTWHRDAALLLLALFRLGHAEEGRRYLHFLLTTCGGVGDVLSPLVGIHGVTREEEILDHLDGYVGSRPVRIGNEAAHQLQFDTYGHVLDAALSYQQLTGELTGTQWQVLRRHVDTMAARWREPDHGIWEIRGPPRHYVNSKMMAWVCLDRGVRLADLVGDHDAPIERWRGERDAVHAEVLERGFDRGVGSFVLAYDSTELDASLLRMPLVGFLAGGDPLVVATIGRIRRDLAIAPALIRRYTADDGLPGEEGAFLLCSFELVSALVLAGRREQAAELFDQLRAYAGPLGLYAEQLDADGTALGNYPQAFTHLALIEAALNLDGAGDRDALHAWAERTARQGTAGG